MAAKNASRFLKTLWLPFSTRPSDQGNTGNRRQPVPQTGWARRRRDWAGKGWKSKNPREKWCGGYPVAGAEQSTPHRPVKAINQSNAYLHYDSPHDSIIIQAFFSSFFLFLNLNVGTLFIAGILNNACLLDKHVMRLLWIIVISELTLRLSSSLVLRSALGGWPFEKVNHLFYVHDVLQITK